MPIVLDGTAGITQPSITTAFGLPSGTTAQRPSPAVAGMLRFNTETALVEAYTGSEWSAGVDVEQAIADFAAGEPGQPRLVGNAVSVFPGTYPVLTVTASNAFSVNTGLGTTVADGSTTGSTFVNGTRHTIDKYTGSINFRAVFSTPGVSAGTVEGRVLKNGTVVQTISGTFDTFGASVGPVNISVVPGDIILWQIRCVSAGIARVANGSNTASNGYLLRELFAPAI